MGSAGSSHELLKASRLSSATTCHDVQGMCLEKHTHCEGGAACTPPRASECGTFLNGGRELDDETWSDEAIRDAEWYNLKVILRKNVTDFDVFIFQECVQYKGGKKEAVCNQMHIIVQAAETGLLATVR